MLESEVLVVPARDNLGQLLVTVYTRVLFRLCRKVAFDVLWHVSDIDNPLCRPNANPNNYRGVEDSDSPTDEDFRLDKS